MALNGSSSSSRRSRRVQVSAAATAAAVSRPSCSAASVASRRVAVVGQQLVHPLVHPHPDRAVRGQQRRRPGGSGPAPARPGSRPAGCGGGAGLEPDRRRDPGQHVVAGEQQVGGLVGEHHVAPGVPGGGHRAQPAPGGRRPAAGPSSTISAPSSSHSSGQLPERRVARWWQRRLQPAQQLVRPGPAQPLQVRPAFPGPPVLDDLQAGLLAAAEGDPRCRTRGAARRPGCSGRGARG